VWYAADSSTPTETTLWTATATPTCGTQTFTASFSFAAVSGVLPPSSTAAVSFPLEVTGPGPCFCQTECPGLQVGIVWSEITITDDFGTWWY
jgi:hypothetical protein